MVCFVDVVVTFVCPNGISSFNVCNNRNGFGLLIAAWSFGDYAIQRGQKVHSNSGFLFEMKLAKMVNECSVFCECKQNECRMWNA